MNFLSCTPKSCSTLVALAFLFPGVPHGNPLHSADRPVFGQALIVGGGPDLRHNQAAIESNVRYVDRLLPNATPRRILFADGNPDRKEVLCEDENSKDYYRTPQISKIDGAAQRTQVHRELDTISERLSEKPKTPVLLYFTGHGSPNQEGEFDNNSYDLWGDDELSVKDLASSIKTFPEGAAVTLVMVQCFSGSFGNLIFQNGDPKQPLAKQNLCGFFACVSERMAAGCTPAVNEAYYKDFTSYFFAALTGKDRLGRPVIGADYNHDGRVEMDEAYAYTILHDDSIDTPVCTSDVYLRAFVKKPDAETLATPYSQIVRWSTPAQKAALEGLSVQLKMDGEDIPLQAYNEFAHINVQSMDSRDVHLIRFVRLCKSVVLAHELARTGTKEEKDGFRRLTQAEHGNPFL
ncbi:MAG TPA: hypothetical protein VG944_01305 [Fimbriimonas sp.]|nr:hypothetical protein [Fimbriimonas sp.]